MSIFNFQKNTGTKLYWPEITPVSRYVLNKALGGDGEAKQIIDDEMERMHFEGIYDANDNRIYPPKVSDNGAGGELPIADEGGAGYYPNGYTGNQPNQGSVGGCVHVDMPEPTYGAGGTANNSNGAGGG